MTDKRGPYPPGRSFLSCFFPPDFARACRKHLHLSLHHPCSATFTSLRVAALLTFILWIDSLNNIKHEYLHPARLSSSTIIVEYVYRSATTIVQHECRPARVSLSTTITQRGPWHYRFPAPPSSSRLQYAAFPPFRGQRRQAASTSSRHAESAHSHTSLGAPTALARSHALHLALPQPASSTSARPA